MLNTQNLRINNTTEFNSPASGIIQRSNKKSFFISFHQSSPLARELFTDKPKYKDKDVFILQMILSHEERIISELVFSEQFDINT